MGQISLGDRVRITSAVTFALRTPKKRVLCLLEVYRGIDTARVIRQLEWHLLALEHGLPSLQYGFTSANKVLLVFETEVALHAVLKRLLTRPGFEEFAPLIVCSTLERLRKNFQDWWYVRGGEIKGADWSNDANLPNWAVSMSTTSRLR